MTPTQKSHFFIMLFIFAAAAFYFFQNSPLVNSAIK